MEHAFELIFERHPDPMWVYDVETLGFLDVNLAAIQKYGYSRAEFLALTLNDIRPPEQRAALAQSMASIAWHGGESAGIFQHRIKGGALLMVEVRSSGLHYRGRAARLVIARDLTRQLALEDERAALVMRERRSRQQAEAAAQHFQSLFEAVPGKFLVLRPDDFEIVTASDAYLAATMTSRDRIKGRPLFEVFPGDPQDPRADGARNLRRSLEQVRATGLADVMAVQHYPIPRPDGSGFEERYWSPVNTPVRAANGKLAYIIHQVEDVTELVRASEEREAGTGLSAMKDQTRHLQLDIQLRSRELKAATDRIGHRDAMLRSAQRLVAMGSWELHLRTGAFDWSDNVYEIFGIEPADFEQNFQAFLQFVHPEDRAEVAAAQQRAVTEKVHMDLVHRIVRPDGAVRFVRQAAEAVTTAAGDVLAGVVQDITADRLAAAEAAAAFDLLRIAGRVARLGGWRFQAADAQFFWSPETCHIHGAPESSAPAFDAAMEYFTAEDRDRIRTAFSRCLDEGTPFDEVARIETASTSRWVRIIGEANRSATGEIVAAGGAFQDISELVSAKEQSERLLRRLRDTLESISDAFYVLDAAFRFSFLNSEAERLLQRPRSEVLNRHIWDVFPHAAAALRPQYESAVASGRPLQMEFFYPPLATWFHLKAYPTRDGLAVYFRDVTNERRTQQEVLLLQSAVARQSDILIITDAGSIDGPDGPRIVYVNEAFVKHTGYSREEVLGRSPKLLRGRGAAGSELDKIRRALRRREPVRAELVNSTKGGEELRMEVDLAPIFDASGEHTHWVAVERDITERKKAEQRALISEERFRLLARATNDVVWDWDLVTDALWWNESYETLFGYDRAAVEAGSGSWINGIHPDDRERVAAGIHAVIRGQGTHWSDEYRFVGAGGQVLQVIDRGFVIRDDAGAPVRMLGSMIDVTEMKRLQDQLRQSQRLDAIGQLTGGVAHDFNNLLTVILGNAEILLEEVGYDPALALLAETTLHAAERGAELTSRLLAFARKQALDPQPTDINRLIGSMEGLIRRALGAHLEIETALAPDLWHALVDAAQLEAAVLNLCINARDAMATGGRLTLETSNLLLEDTAASGVPGLAAGPYVVIAVADTGVGMLPATLSRAFEPFFTTKEIGKGSGLGLSMVYGFVQQSKGHVYIESSPGRGTRVSLFLPRAPGTAPEAAEPHTAVLQTGAETILLVEDDDLVRAYVRAQLQTLGYRVRSVESGRDALEVLRHERVHLLFSDVVMPGGLTGREVAREARKLQPDLPVLLTSGYAEAAGTPEAPGAVQFPLLPKPYRRQELAARIRAVLDRGAARDARAPSATDAIITKDQPDA